MNWDALGAIAEIIGAAAVLVTLIYLARQVKHNRESVESATAESIMSTLITTTATAASSPGLSGLLIRGQAGMDSLSEDERSQFVFWFTGYFRIIEQAYHHYLEDNFKTELWEGHSRHFHAMVKTQGVYRFWSLRKSIFTPEFQVYVEELIKSESDPVSGTDTVNLMTRDEPKPRDE